ncbi:MAG: glycosyltransferase family 39 protein [Candidatus Omnitrophota bacterium]
MRYTSTDAVKRHAPFLMIFLAGLLLRVWTIGYGTNVDEGDYLMQGREMTHGYWPYRDVHLNKPPLVSFLAYPFFLVFNIPIIPARIFMIAVSASALAALYGLGRLCGEERGGLLAAGFFAFDPFAAVWAKYLHVSTLAPVLSLWALVCFLWGMKSQRRIGLMLSGVFAALCLLNKQTGVIVLPALFFAFLLFENRRWRDWQWFLLGFFPLPLLLIFYLALLNAFEPFFYDIYYSNFAMADFFNQSAAARWGEFLAVEYWNPIAWYGIAAGLVIMALKRRRYLIWLIVWFSLEFGVNIFALSHIWQHYVLAIMPSAFALSGLGLAALLDWAPLRRRLSEPANRWLPAVMALILTAPFWMRADWRYPNMTLEDERGFAAQIARHCPSPYLLCFANAAYFMLTDKEVPPSIRHGRKVRIPPFMNTAGRKYLSLEDMKKTVELWRTLPMDYCVMYDKYARQIFIDQDPHLEPVRQFLENDFERAPNLSKNLRTYYAHMICFARKRN